MGQKSLVGYCERNYKGSNFGALAYADQQKGLSGFIKSSDCIGVHSGI
jgi:hypothetical protein